MSIRTRLTLCFTILFGAIVCGLAAGSYVLMRNSLFADLRTQLQVAVNATAMSAVHEFDEHDRLAEGEKDLRSVLDAEQEADLPRFQILVRQGDRLAAYKRGNATRLDLRTLPIASLRQDSVAGVLLVSHDFPVAKFDAHYRIYAAAPTAGIAERLHRFALLLAILVPLGLFVAGSVGYLLARKTLSPLDDLSRTIELVTSSDLSMRVHVGTNDSELSRIGRRFNSLLDRLQSAFDSQLRFMADASHELRTPVTVALAAAQVTARDPARSLPEADEALQLIEKQILRVRNTVEQLLLLSKADATPMSNTFRDIYLDDVVGEAVRSARALARVKQQSVVIGELPEARVKGDPELLCQALMVLLDNAVKFTPAGGTIAIGIIRRGAFWTCQVSDTGRGISEAAQAHIFDRFYSGGKAGPGEASGAGLGLAIAKVIVESHGGTLALAASQPGRTVFEISLVAAEDAPVDRVSGQPNSLAVKI